MRNALASAAAVFAAAALPAAAYAMSVSPVVIDLEPGGRVASQTIVVQNTRSHAIPVEMRVEGMAFTAEGAQGTAQDPGDLLVFPAQAVIPPGQSQAFRVQYVGEPTLAKSRHYFVTAAQLPVQLPQGQTGIQVLYNLQVMVSVAPRGGRPGLKVVRAEAGRDADGRPVPVVTLANAGGAHGYLSRGRLTVVQKDAGGRELLRKTLSGAEIQQSAGYGLVGGGETRSFALPIPLPAQGGAVEARFDPEPRS